MMRKPRFGRPVIPDGLKKFETEVRLQNDRRAGYFYDKITIGDDIVVVVRLDSRGDVVVGIDAPEGLSIDRVNRYGDYECNPRKHRNRS